jgi:23S rRNA (adenine2030-N6)-methyltransferase
VNYRHAYHAGNAADCLKHALLVWLLQALARKPAGFTVLDTHAGIGGYDLSGPEAETTGEWRAGIGRLRADPPAVLRDYVSLAEDPARYPGSPLIARSLLRPQDGLICCERHPEDAALLRRCFAGDAQVAVHCRDGYEALAALLPPATKRGLVLIDPPYEQPDEYARLQTGIATARARFGTAVVAAWFPVKHLAPVHALRHGLGDLRDVVVASLWQRPPLDPTRLNGSGLIVVNPPYGFEAAAAEIIAALQGRLAEDGGGGSVERWSDE